MAKILDTEPISDEFKLSSIQKQFLQTSIKSIKHRKSARNYKNPKGLDKYLENIEAKIRADSITQDEHKMFFTRVVSYIV